MFDTNDSYAFNLKNKNKNAIIFLYKNLFSLKMIL